MRVFETTFQPTEDELPVHLKAVQLVVFIRSEDFGDAGLPVRIDITSEDPIGECEVIGGIIASPPRFAGQIAVARLNLMTGTGMLEVWDN
jgi:hypothetical protein